MEHYRTNLEETVAFENRLLWTINDTLVLKTRVRKIITRLRQLLEKALNKHITAVSFNILPTSSCNSQIVRYKIRMSTGQRASLTKC